MKAACSLSAEVFRTLAAGEALPARLADHTAGCADCRAAAQRADRFEEELQAGAGMLASRDMPNLTTAGADDSQSRSARWLPAVGTAGFAVILALVVVTGYDRFWSIGGSDSGPPESAVASQTPEATGSPPPSPSGAVFLPAGSMALADGIPVYAEPGAAEPFTLLEGQHVYIRHQAEADNGTRWQEVQVGYGIDWVFGWIPLDATGVPALQPVAEPPCPTPEEFAGGFMMDTPARPKCLRDGSWSISGYLIREPGLAPDWPYQGEPAWLVGPPEYRLVGAIGAAVTTWGLALHFDPALGVEIDPGWLSDREATAGRRVTISVLVRHEAAGSCALTARDLDLADPTPLQAAGWCQQRVVVTSMLPGFADPPAERIDGVLVECENPVDGYVVGMPSDWFANAEGAIGPCSLFSPLRPPLAGSSSVDGSSIQLFLLEGGFGFVEPPHYVASERMDWGGRTVTRDEVRSEDGSLEYRYIIELGGKAGAGPTLVATTSNINPGAYETNKAVLDIMVRNFDLSRSSEDG